MGRMVSTKKTYMFIIINFIAKHQKCPFKIRNKTESHISTSGVLVVLDTVVRNKRGKKDIRIGE